MQVKAEAFQQYGQAAILDKLLGAIPEVVHGMAEPLAKVDRITVVSTGGDGSGTGVNQITGDVAKMVAQAPALIETLTGMKISELMRYLPGIQVPAETIESKAVAESPAPEAKGADWQKLA
jgi:flotillin